MKKFILTSLLSFSTLFIVSAQAVPTMCVNLQNNLSYNNRDTQEQDPVLYKEVLDLQNFLAKTKSPVTRRGYLSQNDINTGAGFFGRKTSLAVRAFQFENKITNQSGNLIATTRFPRTLSEVTVTSETRNFLSCKGTPKVEFIGNPTLNLQYNGQSVLVGQAVVKITAGSIPVSTFNIPYILQLNRIGQGMIDQNITRSANRTDGGVGDSIPAYESAVFNVIISVPTAYIPAGQYTVVSSVSSQAVPAQSFNGTLVNIIGETQVGLVVTGDVQSPNTTTVGDPVSVVGDPLTSGVDDLSPTGAILNMIFNSLGQAYTTYFVWGTTQSGLVNQAPATLNTNVPVEYSVYSASLTGLLKPNTEYYYQAKASGNNGQILSGNLLSFMTSPETGCLSGYNSVGGKCVIAPALTFNVRSALSNGSNSMFATSTTGAPVYLTWSTTDVYSCTASNAWTGRKALISSGEALYPTNPTTTYTLTCNGAGGSVSKFVVINVVNPATATKPDVSLRVIPNIVSSFPATVSVSGSALNASNCYAYTTPVNTLWNGEKPVNGTTPVSITITGQNTFSFGCSGTYGSTTQSVTVISQTSTNVTSPRITSSGVTFVTNSSPVAQYVLGNSNFQIAKFNVKTVSSASGVILKDLVFTVRPNTITSLSVNGRSAAVVGTIAALYNANMIVPADTNDLDLNVSVTLACADAVGGCSGVSSSLVDLNFSSLTYNYGTSTLAPVTLNLSTPVHTLVVSKPSLTVNPSASGTFGNGVSKIGEFTIAADASGNIEIKQIPIYISLTGGISITPGSVELRDRDGNAVIPNSNKINGSGNFILATPRSLAKGTSETYSVYATLTGTSGSIGSQTVIFQLGDKSSFIWNDTAGQALGLSGKNIANYPTASQTSTSGAQCSYPAPVSGCTYALGPNYSSVTQCGKVLLCSYVVPTPPVVIPIPVPNPAVLPVITPVSAPTPVALSVLTPNGGEVYKIGETMTLSWRTPRVSMSNNSISVQVHDNSTPYKTLYTAYLSNPVVNGVVSQDGSQVITIPANTVPGMYTLYISNADGWDESDAYFTVNAATVSPCIDADVNGDGLVNDTDINYVKSKAGTTANDAGFDTKADLNKDGVINSSDISKIKALVPQCVQ